MAKNEKRFQTNYDRKTCATRYEISRGVSETVQGQAYSIRELLEKFVSGAIPDIGKVPQYEEDPTFEQTDILRRPDVDIVDVHEEIETIRARQENARKSLSDQDTQPEKSPDQVNNDPEPDKG